MTEQELDDTTYGRGLGLPGCAAYSQAELDAAVLEAVAAERQRCVAICEQIEDEYRRREGNEFPEMKTDAQTGAAQCAYSIQIDDQ